MRLHNFEKNAEAEAAFKKKYDNMQVFKYQHKERERERDIHTQTYIYICI